MNVYGSEFDIFVWVIKFVIIFVGDKEFKSSNGIICLFLCYINLCMMLKWVLI